MDTLFERIWQRKFSFFSAFFIAFSLTYLALMALDFLPEPPTEEVIEEVEITKTIADQDEEPELELVTTDEPVYTEPVFPIKLTINKLGKEVDILNPVSRSIVDLDNALLSGVVRHPDSATLDQEGNVFILGHSSYLPQVFNKNFQAFNGIQDLEWGDIIEVATAEAVYEYRVEKVYKAKATEITVPIAGEGNRLILATCNSFGSVDDRYIVEADRISVRAL